MNENRFSIRRNNLIKEIEDRSIVILYSLEAPHKTTDQYYPYEINRNFYYLTGLKKSNFTLLLQKDGKNQFEYLFIEEATDYSNKWLGKRMTKQEASLLSGIDEKNIFFVEQLDTFLHQQILSGQRKALARAPKQIYLDLYRHKPYAVPVALTKLDAVLKSYPEITYRNINEFLDIMRMYKDEFEVSEIRRAISYSKAGVEAILSVATPGINERSIVAMYEYALKTHNSEGNSFNPIVASGGNATTLHYEENDQTAEDGSLVLCDLGALAGPYASDISRTFPVNGKFSTRQKEIYELVLSVNKACIDFVKPGIMMSELNLHARNLLAEGAMKLGLIQSLDEISKYYYHNVSHYLGLDVHDVGSYLIPLKAGVVLTIEPGFYIEEENIGIRIEDNVLVTETGSINLSESIIKEVKDIEEFMSK